MKSDIEYSGYWVKSDKNYVCRYFVSWINLAKDHYCGVVSGYSGHGSFEVERFRLVGEKGSISSLWIDFTDRVSGVEIDFDSLGAEVLKKCDLCIDLMWEWNNYERWNQDDNLVLQEAKRRSLIPIAQADYQASTTESFLTRAVCLAVGLTATPRT